MTALFRSLFSLFLLFLARAVLAELEDVPRHIRADLNHERVHLIVSRLYRDRNYGPIWLGSREGRERGEALVDFIKEISVEGLNPNDYFLPELRAYGRRKDDMDQAQYDVFLTRAVARLASDAAFGVRRARLADSEKAVTAGPIGNDAEATIRRAIDSDDPAQEIRRLFPAHRQYGRMRQALERYRSLSARYDRTPAIATKVTLKKDDKGAAVSQLQSRLLANGDLENASDVSSEFDAKTESALRAFQRRHGLTSDGTAGPQTVAALNVPLSERVEELRVNLERWRWLDRDLGRKFVLVNIAGFELFVIEDAAPVLRLPVIVGKQYHQTPVFSGRIQYTELNPHWNVPTSIARNEILPKLKKSGNYLQSQHMRLFKGDTEVNPASISWKSMSPQALGAYQIRQDPGPWNALGTIKFIFPNEHDVYLHDTPSRSLFTQTNRAFSHGCVRVSTPLRLAAELLADSSGNWSIERLEEALATRENRRVSLADPIPVHILYRTAWVDPDGSVQFRPDVYGRDAKVRRALAGGAGL